MNVLYLNTHDIGRYISAYGYQVATPNLMELARDGALFRNVHCAHPTCSPSRGALLTGQYPHTNGLTGLSHRGFEITDKSHHLASYLREQGYQTALAGVQHEIRLRQETLLGYEIVLNPERYYEKGHRQEEFLTLQDEMATEAAVAFINSRAAEDPPFYLAVGFGCTHREYPDLPADDTADYIKPPEWMPDTPQTRIDMARLRIAIEQMDEYCGQILQALKTSGQYDDTVILFTTDHGLPFPKAKCTLYDDGTGVAMILRVPGMGVKPLISDALLSQVDVYPTLCELLGLPMPKWLQGQSFVPVLTGAATEIREAVYAEIDYHIAYEPVRSVRSKRYKYIRHYLTEFPYPIPCHIDDSLSKEVFHDGNAFAEKIPAEELYDLLLDPQERNNLAGRKEWQQEQRQMQTYLEAWQQETKDPLLLDGTLMLPVGAIASTPDSYSTSTQVILPECRPYLAGLKDVLQNNINE